MVLLALLLPGILLPVAAFAGEHVDRVLGWTADGRYVAWASTEEEAGAADPTEDAMEERLAWRAVLDTTTGAIDKYLLDFQNLEGGGFDGKTAPDWRAWAAANPLVHAPEGPSGPGGARAVVQRCDDGPPGSWTAGEMPIEGKGACLDLGVDLRGKTWWTAHAVLPAPALQTPAFVLRVAWAPDGGRVVWLIGDAGGPGSSELVQALAGSLASKVEVLVPPALQQTAGPKVVAAVLDAKAGAVLQGTALQERPRTVVYADTTHQDLAKKVAEAVPGGASVETLTWKANAPIVIAVGASAN